MDVILIPGFWLDASSWGDLPAALERAGHRARPLTLPGLESPEADRRGITLRDHVDAVVAAVDESDGPVVLVGHSGGGAIAHAVADARPDRVARVVHVDSVPLGDGDRINDSLPAENGEVPLPDFAEFPEEMLRDLDDDLRAAFRARAVPQPEGVARGQQRLSDRPRRYEIPVTIVACEMPSSMLRELMEQGHPYVAELARMRSVDYVDIPTSHWPQFTKPAELTEAVLAAVARS